MDFPLEYITGFSLLARFTLHKIASYVRSARTPARSPRSTYRRVSAVIELFTDRPIARAHISSVIIGRLGSRTLEHARAHRTGSSRSRVGDVSYD